MAKTKKHKGRGQSGRLSAPPDSTVCCFCEHKKPKMRLVQIGTGNRSWPACAECRKDNDGRWRYPK